MDNTQAVGRPGRPDPAIASWTLPLRLDAAEQMALVNGVGVLWGQWLEAVSSGAVSCQKLPVAYFGEAIKLPNFCGLHHHSFPDEAKQIWQ